MYKNSGARLPKEGILRVKLRQKMPKGKIIRGKLIRVSVTQGKSTTYKPLQVTKLHSTVVTEFLTDPV